MGSKFQSISTISLRNEEKINTADDNEILVRLLNDQQKFSSSLFITTSYRDSHALLTGDFIDLLEIFQFYSEETCLRTNVALLLSVLMQATLNTRHKQYEKPIRQ